LLRDHGRFLPIWRPARCHDFTERPSAAIIFWESPSHWVSIPRNENDASLIADVHLLEPLRAAAVRRSTTAMLRSPVSSHHSIPSIRVGPGRGSHGPRQRTGHPLPSETLAGTVAHRCDCSVVVGTTQALTGVSGKAFMAPTIDGDFDDAAPDAGRSQVGHLGRLASHPRLTLS